MMNDYLVYKHTSPSGKSYVGQTNNYIRCSREHRRVKSNSVSFNNAIQKYGWEKFTHEVIADHLTVFEANVLEELCIRHFNTLVPCGYNLRSGGLNKLVSESTKKKMTQPKSMEHKRKISEALRRRIRSPHTEQTKIKMSVVKLGHPGHKHTEQTKLKLKQPKSEETKQKMSEHARLHRPPMSEATKQKIREARTGTKRSLASITKQQNTRRLKSI